MLQQAWSWGLEENAGGSFKGREAGEIAGRCWRNGGRRNTGDIVCV